MQKTKLLKTIISTACFLFLFFLKTASVSAAATYYASPTGSGTACSNSSPCAVNYATNTKVAAGDTVLLKDGTYTGAAYMIVPTNSGTSGNPITIKAVNDGAVTIDGQGVRSPCDIYQKSYLNLEGVICKNSNADAIYIHGNSSYINVRRVSAYDAKDNGNYHVVSLSSSDHILLEDIAASNTGRYMYDIYESDHVTLRRCYGRWTDYVSNPTSMPKGIIQIYGSNYNTIENCVGFSANISNTGGAFPIWANTYNASASHNKVYGTVMSGAFSGSSFSTSAAANETNTNDATDNEFYNIVALNNTTSGISAFHHRAGSVIIKGSRPSN